MSADTLVLRDCKLANGTEVDIRLETGRVHSFSSQPADDAPVINLGGRLVLPALVDAHLHLDKTLLGLSWQPHRAENTTLGRIEGEKALRRSLRPNVEQCGAALLSLALKKGTTAVRSHVDVDDLAGLENVTSVLRLREAWRDFIDIQLVAFPQSGIKRCPGVAELLNEALAMGCDLIGGLDPVGVDGDLKGHLDVIFGIAERRGVGVDIHLHDLGEQGVDEALAIAERTKVLGLSGRVAISHAFCFGSVANSRASRAAERLADADVTIVTSAPGAAPMPPITLLREAGVRVVAGSDNIRDAWSPFGNASMLERCWLIAYRSGYRTDEEIVSTFDLASVNPASLLGLERHLAPGFSADLIVLPARTLVQAIIERPPPDLVLHHGRIVHGASSLGSELSRAMIHPMPSGEHSI
jgi:cytosine/adenosine deaminase-related metal-dependent hydrolase